MVFKGSIWPQYVSQTYVLCSCSENLACFAENVELDSSVNVCSRLKLTKVSFQGMGR